MLSDIRLSEDSNVYETQGVGPPPPPSPDDVPTTLFESDVSIPERSPSDNPSEVTLHIPVQEAVHDDPHESSEISMEMTDSDYIESSSDSESNTLEDDQSMALSDSPNLSLSAPAYNTGSNSVITSTENSKNKKNTSIAVQENIKNQKHVPLQSNENQKEKKNQPSMAERLKRHTDGAKGNSAILSDYKYVKQEHTLRYTAQERLRFESQLKVLGQFLNPRELIHHMADLPESDLSLKLAICNPNGLSNEELSQGLHQFIDRHMILVKEDLLKSQSVTKTTVEQASAYFLSNTNVTESVTRIAEEEHYLSTLLAELKSLTHVASHYVALAAAYNHRLVEGKLFFPNLKLNEEAQKLLHDCLGEELPFQIYTDPSESVKYLVDILTSTDLDYNQQDDKVFQLEVPQTTSSHIIAVQVNYNTTANAKNYFRRSFLHHSDEILDWLDKAPSQKRSSATVLIRLGLMRTPPKRVSKDLWLKNQEQLVPSLYSLFSSFSEKSTRLYEKARTEGYTGQNPVRHVAVLKQKHEAYLKQAGSHPLKQPAYDTFGMECIMKYAPQYCHICNTIEHSFRNCSNPRKGCWICHQPSHAWYHCKKSCKCPYSKHLRGSPDFPLTVVTSAPTTHATASQIEPSDGFTLVTKRGHKRTPLSVQQGAVTMTSPSSQDAPFNPYAALEHLLDEDMIEEPRPLSVTDCSNSPQGKEPEESATNPLSPSLLVQDPVELQPSPSVIVETDDLQPFSGVQHSLDIPLEPIDSTTPPTSTQLVEEAPMFEIEIPTVPEGPTSSHNTSNQAPFAADVQSIPDENTPTASDSIPAIPPNIPTPSTTASRRREFPQSNHTIPKRRSARLAGKIVSYHSHIISKPKKSPTTFSRSSYSIQEAQTSSSPQTHNHPSPPTDSLLNISPINIHPSDGTDPPGTDFADTPPDPGPQDHSNANERLVSATQPEIILTPVSTDIPTMLATSDLEMNKVEDSHGDKTLPPGQNSHHIN